MTECKALPLQSGDEEGSSTLSQLKTNKLVHSEEKNKPQERITITTHISISFFSNSLVIQRERDRPTTVKTTIFLQKLV